MRNVDADYKILDVPILIISSKLDTFSWYFM